LLTWTKYSKNSLLLTCSCSLVHARRFVDYNPSSLSILDMKTLESKAFFFLLWKVYCFLSRPKFPSTSTSYIWLSLYDLRKTFKECPWKIVYDNGHFQILIIVGMLFGQYKMNNPNWFSLKSSSNTTSLGSHVINYPLTMKTPSTSTTSHSVPLQLQCLNERTFVL